MKLSSFRASRRARIALFYGKRVGCAFAYVTSPLRTAASGFAEAPGRRARRRGEAVRGHKRALVRGKPRSVLEHDGFP